MSFSRTRREFLRVLGLGAGAALLSRCAPARRRRQRPNIVFLLTDDQRWDTLRCTGNPVIQTPSLDRLASEGTRFVNAFVTTSICPVSRVSILTGQHVRRHGIRGFHTRLSKAAMMQTYPVLLREAGYYTGFLGKWGIGDSQDAIKRVSSAFDYWAGAPHHGNYWHEATCRYVTHDGVVHKRRNICDCTPRGPRSRRGHEGMKNPKHMTTEITPAKFVQFLDSRDAAKPFCISISFKAAHVPWSDWDPQLADLYENEPMPIRTTATPQDAASQPDFLRESLSGEGMGKRVSDPEKLQRRTREYYRLISGADIAIGEIRRALDERDLARDTVIVFSSDNGYLLGEHGLSRKWLMYEESIRVPLLIVDPRLPADARGRTCEEMALNIDIAPTLLEFGGVATPEPMQGKSLVPLLSQPVSPFREDWFYEHRFKSKTHPIERTEGVRSRRWKYIRYTDQRPVYEQLFDLEVDPTETRNLAAIASHGATLEHMRSRWRFHRQSSK